MTAADEARLAKLDPVLSAQLDSVVEDLKRGRVTFRFILGAGGNLAGDAPREVDDWLGQLPPSGPELAQYLSAHFKYDGADAADLIRVSQYIRTLRGDSGPLYDVLQEVFDVNFPITPVHAFIAGVPAALRSAVPEAKPPLILTTNYDDLMERAFDAVPEPYDVVAYAAEGDYAGRFCMITEDGDLDPFVDPATEVGVNPDRRPVILKVHGFVERGAPPDDNDDSYVITEDHYIEYLARMELEKLIPVEVLERMRNCHYLVLGYSLADWQITTFDLAVADYIELLSARFCESLAAKATGTRCASHLSAGGSRARRVGVAVRRSGTSEARVKRNGRTPRMNPPSRTRRFERSGASRRCPRWCCPRSARRRRGASPRATHCSARRRGRGPGTAGQGRCRATPRPTLRWRVSAPTAGAAPRRSSPSATHPRTGHITATSKLPFSASMNPNTATGSRCPPSRRSEEGRRPF